MGGWKEFQEVGEEIELIQSSICDVGCKFGGAQIISGVLTSKKATGWTSYEWLNTNPFLYQVIVAPRWLMGPTPPSHPPPRNEDVVRVVLALRAQGGICDETEVAGEVKMVKHFQTFSGLQFALPLQKTWRRSLHSDALGGTMRPLGGAPGRERDSDWDASRLRRLATSSSSPGRRRPPLAQAG